MQEHLATLPDDELQESREINAELLAVLKQALCSADDCHEPGDNKFPFNKAEAIIAKAERFLN